MPVALTYRAYTSCCSAYQGERVGNVSEPVSAATQEFGRRLRVERELLDVTQRDLALEADIDEATYRKIESGQRNVSLHNMIRIAKALGVDLGQLTTGLADFAVPPRSEPTAAKPTVAEKRRLRDARRAGGASS